MSSDPHSPSPVDVSVSALSGVLDAVRGAIASPRHDVPVGVLEGRVTGLSGLSVSLSGLRDFTGVGDRVTIYGLDGRQTQAEIVAFAQD
ncbi:MAG: flagellum-specific ATP synthase FliI, partial [Acetobacter okinawensis]